MLFNIDVLNAYFLSKLPFDIETLQNSSLQTLLIYAGVVGVTFIVAFIFALQLYATLTCGVCISRKRMDGKTVLITGGNGGIGKETVKELAKRGARIIMACRNVDKANLVKDEIIKLSGNSNISVMKLDLSSQKSIREFAREFLRTENKLHVLIHNAGTAETRSRVTEDGFDQTLATNHFGPFLLTHLLIDVLKRSQPARIVVVASELYRLSSINLDKINPTNSWFPTYLYYVSKYANIYFTLELSKRLAGSGVTANCLHPGLVDSGIWTENVPPPLSWFTKAIAKCFFKTCEQGAQTTVYVTVAEELERVSGKYFSDCKESTLKPMDEERVRKYWELTSQLVKLQPNDPKI